MAALLGASASFGPAGPPSAAGEPVVRIDQSVKLVLPLN